MFDLTSVLVTEILERADLRSTCWIIDLHNSFSTTVFTKNVMHFGSSFGLQHFGELKIKFLKSIPYAALRQLQKREFEKIMALCLRVSDIVTFCRCCQRIFGEM